MFIINANIKVFFIEYFLVNQVTYKVIKETPKKGKFPNII